MKKKLNFSILLIILCNYAFSQSKSIGFSTGYSFAKFLTGKELTTEGVNKPIFNGFYESEFKKHISLKFGLSYYTAGDKENTFDINNKPIILNRAYNYISIPISLRYSLGKKIKPYAKLGGYVSYLIKSNGQPFNQIIDINTIHSINLKSDTKNLDYGILFGVGVEFKFNKLYYVFAETNAIYGLPQFDKYSQNRQHYVSIEVGFKYSLPFSSYK